LERNAGHTPATWMLVLSRKSGERILIGDKIAITVVRIAPGVVRIGVEAPDSLPILREELVTESKLPPTAATVPSPTEAASHSQP
jgi:carbon storage regulator